MLANFYMHEATSLYIGPVMDSIEFIHYEYSSNALSNKLSLYACFAFYINDLTSLFWISRCFSTGYISIISLIWNGSVWNDNIVSNATLYYCYYPFFFDNVCFIWALTLFCWKVNLFWRTFRSLSRMSSLLSWLMILIPSLIQMSHNRLILLFAY